MTVAPEGFVLVAADSFSSIGQGAPTAARGRSTGRKKEVVTSVASQFELFDSERGQTRFLASLKACATLNFHNLPVHPQSIDYAGTHEVAGRTAIGERVRLLQVQGLGSPIGLLLSLKSYMVGVAFENSPSRVRKLNDSRDRRSNATFFVALQTL